MAEAKSPSTSKLIAKLRTMEVAFQDISGLPNDLVLEHIFNAIPALVVLSDANGDVLRANAMAREFVGCGSATDHAVGKSCLDPCSLCKLKAFMTGPEDATVHAGATVHGLVKKIEHEGQEMWMRLDKVPYFGPQSQIQGVLTVAIDVTDLVQSSSR